MHMRPCNPTARVSTRVPHCHHCALPLLQRYHARRKLALQRMEREVEAKVAQLQILERENRQLKVRGRAQRGGTRLPCIARETWAWAWRRPTC